jgi:hypothetical protein
MTKISYNDFLDVHKGHEVIEEYNRFYCKKCNCYSKFEENSKGEKV